MLGIVILLSVRDRLFVVNNRIPFRTVLIYILENSIYPAFKRVPEFGIDIVLLSFETDTRIAIEKFRLGSYDGEHVGGIPFNDISHGGWRGSLGQSGKSCELPVHD